MLKKIYHLSDEGSRRLVKAGLCMCLYNLACLLPVILLAMVADEMLERYFGTVQGSIPLWGYWGTVLILLLLIFLTYRMTYRNKYLTSGQENRKLRMNLADKIRKLPLSYLGRRDLSDLTTAKAGFLLRFYYFSTPSEAPICRDMRGIFRNAKFRKCLIFQAFPTFAKWCQDNQKIGRTFMIKTRKPNEGEAPQYYVENGHPGIVIKSVWQEVQATWTDASRRNCTFSPIANKIICGDCGGRYGRKTWHSTTYRDAVWECISKKAGRAKCKCRHIYAEELDAALRRSVNHLLKTHKNIIPDCTDLLSQAPGEISSDARSVLNDIARGKLDIQIDGLMIGILIRKMVVTPKQTLVIHFLDGTTYRHRLGATPRGTRLYNTQRDHSRMLALYAEGCSAKEISQRLGISVNTVRSFLRRHF